MSYDGQTYYYVFNGHGDVAALTDASGIKVASYRYDPWGGMLKADNDEEGKSDDENEIGELNPYTYAGYRYDAKTKLYFLKNRYYNPLLGRFLSRDKYRGGADEKMGMQSMLQNKYVYVNNNPVNMIDPDGLKGKSVKSSGSKTKSTAARTASNIKNLAKAGSRKTSFRHYC